MSGLAARQSDLFDWDQLRSSGGDASTVRDDLRVLLVAGSDDAAEAYCKLENPVVSQGHLFECAPAVVSVIVAAVADDSVPPANLASALDLLGRIVAGYPDESEIDWATGRSGSAVMTRLGRGTGLSCGWRARETHSTRGVSRSTSCPS